MGIRNSKTNDITLEPISHLPLKYIVLQYLGDEYISYCMGWIKYPKPFENVVNDFHKLVAPRQRKDMRLFVSKYCFRIHTNQSIGDLYNEISQNMSQLFEKNSCYNI